MQEKNLILLVIKTITTASSVYGLVKQFNEYFNKSGKLSPIEFKNRLARHFILIFISLSNFSITFDKREIDKTKIIFSILSFILIIIMFIDLMISILYYSD